MTHRGADSLDDDTFESLSAYLDGALDAQSAALLEAQIAQDPALSDALEALKRQDESLVAAFPPEPDDPAIAELRRLALGPQNASAPILNLRPRMRPDWRAALGGALAMAAAMLIVVAFSAMPPDASGPTHLALGAPADDGFLAELLEKSPTGAERRAGGVVWLAAGTFYDAQGRACRDLEAVTGPTTLEFGVACRIGAGAWRVEFAAIAPPSTDASGLYRPAEGPGFDAFERFIERIGAGPVLSPAEERRLLESWR